MDVILFLIFAVVAVVCAINVVVQTHPISSALSLVGVMGSLAVLYLLLNAGAETNKGRSYLIPGAPLLIVFLGLMAYYVQRYLFPESTVVRFGGFTGGGPKDIGNALFTTYLLPFEVTSILIL